ncbi:AAA family ATPase [Dechloromonas denitrificans]|uniref:bifunctional aminoglycoside phosphotransferase/ATP-binding protein n=1 Tax=Dechloromonas denitrificans TaxID=281362 RepID=UPI001CF8BCAA|nr:bifunctional aminoglycoside phosphotransferase/ATP-binding protein [Dechloromonas denitrificans]
MTTAANASPLADHRRLVLNLQSPAAFDQPVEDIACIETHISSVVLAGQHAYKLKKPLDLGFLDFTTLAKRQAACAEEVRLNRRTAPDLYLDVVPITGSLAAPHIGGSGEAIDYAVRMRRFAQSCLLTEVLADRGLAPELIDRLAHHVAAFHDQAAVARRGDGFGDAAAVHFPVRQNFRQLPELVDDAALLALAKRVENWSEARFADLQAVFERRLDQGRVRECHGDLHLGNLILIDGEPQLFDAIEFNPALRWIDVAADIAFLCMDLQKRGCAWLAHRFLNAWLERSGDYDSLLVLPYYIAYRAMVRAKIAAIRLNQLDGAARAAGLAECRDHVALAAAQMQTPRPFLAITCGLSGSGKTSQSQALLEARGIIRLRADVERKRLFGLAPEAASHSPPNAGLYSAEAGSRTYARLGELARSVVAAGYPVLIDATFLKRAQRAAFAALAGELSLPFVILAFAAPPAVLRQRVRQRIAAGRDASEADEAILDYQLAHHEMPGTDEASRTLSIDSSAAPDWNVLLPQFDELAGDLASPGD